MAEEKEVEVAEQTEFEFPDEKETKGQKVEQKEAKTAEKAEENTLKTADGTEIEVVDDTPAKDRNRKPMQEPPKDLTEDELEDYSDKVKKRLQHFSKGYHEERRRAEAAMREKEEALKLAQMIVEENKKLKSSLGRGQAALIEQARAAVELEVEKAKRKFKEAYEAGDPDALTEAQELLTAAKLKADRINSFKKPLQDKENAVETKSVAPSREVEAPAPAVRPDDRAVAWQKDNPWFGSDDEMTSFAIGLHTKLVKAGVDPKSDDYYEKINSRMRQVFPEQFDDLDGTIEEPPKRVAKSSVVAPATRSVAPKKVKLTETQVNIAKRLGVPLELYAKKVAEEMRKQNG